MAEGCRPASTAVVYNPSKLDDVEAFRFELISALAERDQAQPRWLETTEADPGTGQAREAVAAGVALLLVCGGDGTVSACAAELAGTEVALGLLPSGTGNLLARNLDVPLDRAEAIKVALGPGRRAIDVIEDHTGQRFVVMAGLGLDAAMIRDTDEDAKAKVGWPAYIVGITRALRRTPRTRFTVTADGATPSTLVGVGVLVGNVGRLQGGLAALPDAEPDDGIVDVLVIAPRTARDWPLIAWSLITGQTQKSKAHTLVMRGSRVEVAAARRLPVEFDGELRGDATTLKLAVIPRALTVCVRP